MLQLIVEMVEEGWGKVFPFLTKKFLPEHTIGFKTSSECGAQLEIYWVCIALLIL